MGIICDRNVDEKLSETEYVIINTANKAQLRQRFIHWIGDKHISVTWSAIFWGSQKTLIIDWNILDTIFFCVKSF